MEEEKKTPGRGNVSETALASFIFSQIPSLKNSFVIASCEKPDVRFSTCYVSELGWRKTQREKIYLEVLLL